MMPMYLSMRAVSANSNIMIVEEDSTVAGKVRLIAVNIGGVSGESPSYEPNLQRQFRIQ